MQAIKWVPGGGRGEASTASGDRQSVPMTITMTMTMDDSHGQRLAQSSPLIPILSVWGEFLITFALISRKAFNLSFPFNSPLRYIISGDIT